MLLSQTPLQQVLRLPVFIEHFQEHRALNSHISLSAFVVLHYFSGNQKDADYDRDMQLPFRASDVVLISSTVVVPALVEPDFTLPISKEEQYPLLLAKDILPTTPFPVFQPPRYS